MKGIQIVEVFNKNDKIEVQLKKELLKDLKDTLFLDQNETGFSFLFPELIKNLLNLSYNPESKIGYLEQIMQLKNESALNLEKESVSKILNEVFERVLNFQILCAIKNTIYGTYYINKICTDFLQDKSTKESYVSGMPIIVLENSAILDLFNGNMGVCIKFKEGFYAVFSSYHSYKAIPIQTMPAFEPGFAITIHKSQGSEYNTVMIVLPQDSDSRILSRELLYTGITRAKNTAILCCSKEVIQATVSRGIERYSGISFWS
jgi:ATP-dependent exoDNAse (exonuclease V) alpha subunit